MTWYVLYLVPFQCVVIAKFPGSVGPTTVTADGFQFGFKELVTQVFRFSIDVGNCIH